LKDVLGHEDIAPGRKSDPGPAFPLAALKSRVLGREDDSPPRYVVTASSLNIRKGPDASFEPVAAALRKGTEVFLLEARDRWSLVEVVSNAEVEGWVSNSFIAAVAAPRATHASPPEAAAGDAASSRSAKSAAKAPASEKKAQRAKKQRAAKDA
jgi:N-acetylmuramoyl-L-alanine amidase